MSKIESLFVFLPFQYTQKCLVWLLLLHCQRFFMCVCSTFKSTPNVYCNFTNIITSALFCLPRECTSVSIMFVISFGMLRYFVLNFQHLRLTLGFTVLHCAPLFFLFFHFSFSLSLCVSLEKVCMKNTTRNQRRRKCLWKKWI